jgi:DNA-binding LacI/PurR family transcriptional regulator
MRESSLTSVEICPFKLDRASRDSLTDQLTNALRDAIHSRFYKADAVLPPMPELAKHLGVSEIIVRTAYRRLAGEGLVLARPRRGTVVLPSRSPVWRGHVLCVMCDHDFNFRIAVGVEKIREGLTHNGFLFSQVAVLEDVNADIDFSGLDIALSRPTDFVILFYDRPQVMKRLSESGVPFVVIGNKGDEPPGCVGRIAVSPKQAIDEFVQHCRRARISYVEVVSCSRYDIYEMMVAKALKKAGVSVRRTVVSVHDHVSYRCENVMHDGYDFVERKLSEKNFKFPSLYFVMDDWLASGMLCAFQAHRVRIPEDVKFVCYTNRGFGPIYPKPITFFSCDPFKMGDEFARRIYDYLVLHKPFPNTYVKCEYIVGETFPDVDA